MRELIGLKRQGQFGDALTMAEIGAQQLTDQFLQASGIRSIACSAQRQLTSDRPPGKETSPLGSRDLVVNWGSTEHVANHDHASHIIHDLTKPGDLMFTSFRVRES